MDEKSSTSYYDVTGYWNSKYSSISEDESLRHGIIIPKIPLEDIGIEMQKGRRRQGLAKNQPNRFGLQKNMCKPKTFFLFGLKRSQTKNFFSVWLKILQNQKFLGYKCLQPNR